MAELENIKYLEHSVKCNYLLNLGPCSCGFLDKREAKRNPVSVRYDILDPDFLKSLAQIAHYGAEKYGDLNWHKSRLEGDKSPVNHIYKHLGAYRNNEPYDHKELGQDRKWHLAAIAFNAMMEFWYENTDL